MGGGREIVRIVGIVGIVGIIGIVGIVKIIKIALNSPKLTTNRSCSWYLVNGREENERERSAGVRIIGKNIEIIEII